MSDFNPPGGVTLTNPTTGATLAAWLNLLAPFVLSTGYGATRPVNATAGQIWVKNTGGLPEIYMYDGTDDHLVFSISNFIGTVSADGLGNNTGAIVEIGETTGTLWVKFAGGYALCATLLSGLAGGTETWSLPVTFTDTAKMFCNATVKVSGVARTATITVNSTSQAQVYGWDAAGATSNPTIYAFVLGYWTEEFT